MRYFIVGGELRFTLNKRSEYNLSLHRNKKIGEALSKYYSN